MRHIMFDEKILTIIYIFYCRVNNNFISLLHFTRSQKASSYHF
jgi:hypothetical protein